MPTKQTTLIFPSLKQLWDFAQEIEVKSMEIKTASRELICDCNEVSVKLASEKFGAKLKMDMAHAD